jgi:putative aldouronate transport system substrate-binding protein
LHIANRDYYPAESYPPGDNLTNNPWTRGIKDTLNINIIADWAAVPTEYTTRLNLAIASGQLPDSFRVDAVQFDQLCDAGLIADLTDYIENNGSDTLKSIMNDEPNVTDSAKRNGRLYGIPTYGYGPLAMFRMLWIRDDWLQSANAVAPKSFSDLDNLMKTFMDTHPGTYGIGLDKSLSQVFNMGPSFHAYPTIWLAKNDSSIVYGAIQPEMKNLLALWADWYKKGYVKRDFVSMDANALRQDFVTGRFGVVTGTNSWHSGYVHDLCKNQGREAIFGAYEFPSIDGSPIIHPKSFDNSGYLVVNKNYKKVDAAIKSISYIHYIIADAGPLKLMTAEELFPYTNLQHLMYSLKMDNPVDEERQFRQIQEAKNTGNLPAVASSVTIRKWGEIQRWLTKESDNPWPYIQLYWEKSSYMNNIKIIEQNRFINTAIQGAMPPEALSYGSTLDDLLIEGFTKIIVGQEPPSYFDTLVNQWKAAGGDTVTAAVNQKFAKK